MNGSAEEVVIDAPAKLNLGLEILGRRNDGFHEIATIFLAIDLHDTLRLVSAGSLALRCPDPELGAERNLALRALRALRDETEYGGGACVDLIKRIPIAAGLGGASSDAAAALLGARELWRLDISDDALSTIASRLGSDVPFFLHGGCALARGRGEILTPLPLASPIWFVVVSPGIAVQNKTASLYARLCRQDFSDGARISTQAERLRSGLALDPSLLGNAFAKPLYALFPSLAELPQLMRDAGAASIAISGAGPAHYAPFRGVEEAQVTATRLRARLSSPAQVYVTQPASPRPMVPGPL